MLSRAIVFITQGQYKGLKGRVVSSDESKVEVELEAKKKKVHVLRTMVYKLDDPRAPMTQGAGGRAAMQAVSFDRA